MNHNTDPFGERHTDRDPTAEEACLAELLDLNNFQKWGSGMPVSNFYKAMIGGEVPEGLTTQIGVMPHKEGKSYIEGCETQATITVVLQDRANTRDHKTGIHEMYNLDFVETDGELQLMHRVYRQNDPEHGGGRVPFYARRLSEGDMASLVQDAKEIKGIIVEENTELMRLGPLVEEPAEDGFRRFHISDILSVTTGKLISPRGMDALYDLLGYMTDDDPYTTQLGRFAEECKPDLEQSLGSILSKYSEIPETVKDRLSLYRWLCGVTEDMGGDPFLRVDKIGKEGHAVMNFMDELELDHGPGVKDKIIQIPNLTDE